MKKSGFVHGGHVHLDLTRDRTAHSSRRRNNRCPPRASVGTPDGKDGEGLQDKYLSQAKSVLEKLLEQDVQQRPGKNGRCECIWCNGTKERKCSWCDGRGVRYEFVQKSWDEIATDIEKMQESGEPQFMKGPEKVPTRCSACSGRKKLKCAYCRGSGIGSYGHAH